MTNVATIANEMLIAKEVMKTNSVDTVAAQLGYSPMLIVNALYQGERDGKLAYNRKQKTFTAAEGTEVSALSLGEEFTTAGDFNIGAELAQLIANLNSEETDMSAEELMGWLGISDVRVKMLAFVNSKLAMYDLADLKDRKSVYTFITLKENVDKRWGEKQFVQKGKKNDKKQAS
jgi:hypothetical protein